MTLPTDAALMAKMVALHSVRDAGKLQELQKIAQRPADMTNFSALRAQLEKVRRYAQQTNSLAIEQAQSPISLQALDDLEKMRQALLTLRREHSEEYAALQTSGPDQKIAFLLDAIRLSMGAPAAGKTGDDAGALHADADAGAGPAPQRRTMVNPAPASLVEFERLRQEFDNIMPKLQQCRPAPKKPRDPVVTYVAFDHRSQSGGWRFALLAITNFLNYYRSLATHDHSWGLIRVLLFNQLSMTWSL